MPETLTPTEPALDRVEPVDPAVALRRELRRHFEACDLLRPLRIGRYEAGETLDLDVTGVVPARAARVRARVERFVGGGFAGQVYRVRIERIDAEDGPLAGIEVGGVYAIKILKPPSAFACVFRDFLYFLAYQGAFSAQVNPDAVRVGVLWQKLIRRAGRRRFGREDAVCDTYATFYDANFHSFGEINEWVSGRIWKFEVDDRLFERWDFTGEPPPDISSPEYVTKKLFMDDLVALLHEMGAPELARQYEWWTCKSQPNALKRLSYEHSPREGVTAIDFRAGLALLPFLPMSPADFPLILRGLRHGRIVQFDRSDPDRFERFLDAHREDFEDLAPVVAELKEKERIYRASLPDITHHHVRLLTDGSLRRSVREGTIVGWRNGGRIDDKHADRLRRRPGLFAWIFTISLIPLLGPLVLRLWGDKRRRAHVKRMLLSPRYLWRAMRGARVEVLINWHRQGRLADERALALVHRPVRFWVQRILVSWLPPPWHRALCEPSWGWQVLTEKVKFLLRFLRDAPFRERWLLEQVRLGREEGMLSAEEADKIEAQVKDPFIQKYLKCLAVHLCTVPVTQVVMVLVGAAVTGYYLTRGLPWAQALAAGSAAGALVQFLPISPGSIARGLFVVYMMIRERDIKNYYIAAPISFLHVIGYLAFPLQMVAHDPALARFMAGRWATSAVRFVPVFGEHGGLPEHAVFDLFFNLPLSVRRYYHRRPVATIAYILLIVALLAYPLAVLATLAYAGYVSLT